MEGLWYEQPDILSKYKRRDDKLEKIVYSQYGKMIRSGGKCGEDESGSIDTENLKNDSSEDENYHEEGDDPDKKFHYIITEDHGLGTEIPQYTKWKIHYQKKTLSNTKGNFLQHFDSINQTRIIRLTNSFSQS